MVQPQHARADGGRGGDPFNNGGGGGIDSATGVGGVGQPGVDFIGQYGGGGGGGAGVTGAAGGAAAGLSGPGQGAAGGAGGAAGGGAGGNGGIGVVNSGGGGGGGGGHGSVGAILPVGQVTGGAGGGGGSAIGGDGSGGGGGAGGWGAVITGGGALGTLASTVTGGAGGAGGLSLGLAGGSGGSGGLGLRLTGLAPSLTIGAAVTGGAGGVGGASGTGPGGTGGAGGAAVAADGAAAITVAAAITGGAGGLGGVGATAGANGAGGAGIVGQDLAILMAAGGSVTGGLGGDGVTRANALTFTGGANRITFQGATSGLTGAIGVAGTLEFAQTTDVTIANVIAGAGSISKTGAGTLTLTAANAYGANTTISGGVLAVGGTQALGFSSVLLSGGGTLLSAIDWTQSTNNIRVDANETGGVAAAAGRTLTLAGDLAVGEGSTVRFGQAGVPGTVVIAGNFSTSIFPNSRIEVLGGTVRAGGTGFFAGFDFGSLFGTAAGTMLAAGATIDVADTSFAGIRNLTGAGTVTLGVLPATQLALLVDGGASTTFGGVISGAGSVQAITVPGLGPPGAIGTVILTGANTYTGGTYICDCTVLQIGDGGTTGSILGNVISAGTLAFNRSNTYTFAGTISDYNASEGGGIGRVVQMGAGRTILTAANTYTGGTTITNGTLQIGSGGTTGSILGDVVNNGTLAFSRSDAITFPGAISGTGGVQQIGPGSTTLAGVNTYSGGTTITGGRLVIDGDARLGAPTSGLNIDGGALRWGGAPFDLAASRPITLGLAGGTLELAGTSSTIAQGISGLGGLTLADLGSMLTLLGASTYAGPTIVSPGTTLRLGNGGTTGSIAGDVAVGGRLLFDRSNELVLGGAISGGGEVRQVGAGTTVLTGAVSAQQLFIDAGVLQIGAGGASGSVVGAP